MASVPVANYLCAAINLPCQKSRFCHSLQVRAQTYRDEGRSSNYNIVDANLRVLRERIEEVKNKERLEGWCVVDHNHNRQVAGWNYADAETSFKAKRNREFVQFLQHVGMVGATFGLTILSCSLCMCIFSLFVHLTQLA